MAEENKESRTRKVKVTLLKNVNLNGERFKKGDSLSLEKSKEDAFRDAGVVE
ncbi:MULTISPECIES: DUF7210 family protein [Bacillus]|uniref:DUF7210 domain-containing protein n=1 Tax=Bacillus capparidis TaxID=1840411 RepID=A0ABS4CTD4_9BACI|nr:MULTISPECIES: hypothetical protein [Bacillus]MBP1080811.1 hypothetical protein [Bacillus capparidis]MED1097455.1 hypothetical protein [Bacillus capparidis]